LPSLDVDLAGIRCCPRVHFPQDAMIRCVGDAASRVKGLKLYKRRFALFRLDVLPVILIYAAAIAFWWHFAADPSELAVPVPADPTAPVELSAAEKEIELGAEESGALGSFDPETETPEGLDAEDDEDDGPKPPDDITWLVIPAAAVLHALLVLCQTWSVAAKVAVGFDRVHTLRQASHVLVAPQANAGLLELSALETPEEAGQWTFVYQFARYVSTEDADGAFTVLSFPLGMPDSQYAQAAGMAGAPLKEALEKYGKRTNVLKLPSPTFMDLFVEHITAPFFVFQLFCVGMWLLDEYVYYTLFTLATLFMLESTLVWQRLRQYASLRAMRPRPAPLLVFREGAWSKLDAEALVPGDIVSIRRDMAHEAKQREEKAAAKAAAAKKKADTMRMLRSGGKKPDGTKLTMTEMAELWKEVAKAPEKDDSDDIEGTVCPADMLLLSGGAVVNEAMLTGESVPHRKDPLYETGGGGMPVLVDESADGETAAEAGDKWIAGKSGSVLLGGTTILTHSPPVAAQAEGSNDRPGVAAPGTAVQGSVVNAPPDGGAVAYVLRTGFYTSQGDLLRTIQCSTRRVTVDNKEAYYFILLLLVFAVSASGYVLHLGLQDVTRSRYKLLLHCIMIVTSVVPPELPVELAMAVNASLTALVQRGVYCTEPFRIPMAGKVGVTAFDKTGTLTTDKLQVLGIALTGVSGGGSARSVSSKGGVPLSNIANVPEKVLHVLVGCHSLLRVEEQLVGDPLEVSVFNALGWGMATEDRSAALTAPALEQLRKKAEDADALPAHPAGNANSSVRTLHRWPFSSALRRMSALVQVVAAGRPAGEPLVVTKGAPEVIEGRLKTVPDGYKDAYTRLSLSGARVLALAYRSATGMSTSAAISADRDTIERDLMPAGFLVLDCPLKGKSASVIAELRESKHHVVMITGDNPLTAVSVSRQVQIMPADRSAVLLQSAEELSEHGGVPVELQGAFHGLVLRDVPVLSEASAGTAVVSKVTPVTAEWFSTERAADAAPVAVTGAALAKLWDESELLRTVCVRATVFARVSPEQKERVITTLNAAGHDTLMCGDGTNDVGALKQATVGISIISSPKLEKVRDKVLEQRDEVVAKRKDAIAVAKATGGGPPTLQANPELQDMHKQLEEMQQALATEMSMVKFGDASVAAPFTSKTPSIEAAKDIIRQGRCTLVATHQMFQILAVNSLVASYQLSVLFLHGVRMGDTQATIVGMSMAAFFMMISWSKPLDKLAAQRPYDSVFNRPLLIMVFGQFVIHLTAMLVTVHYFAPYMEKDINLDGKFQPNVINSVMFLLTWAMQTTTFAVNYHGEPFMVSLVNNTNLYRGLMVSYAIAFAGALEFVPDINEMLQLVPIPSADLQMVLISVLVVDTALCWALKLAVSGKNGPSAPPKEVK